MLNHKEKEHLRHLEESLWKEEARFDTVYMESILHPDFFEFGRSGRIHERKNTISVTREPIRARLENIQIHEVDNTTVLITYKSFVQYETLEIGNRSSLWVKIGDIWKLYFHQGTPTT